MVSFVLMGRQFAVHSYNILAQNLARSSFFPLARTSSLSATYRKELIKEKLSASMAKQAIVCLQELPAAWEEEFHLFLWENGFDMVSAMYSSGKNSMGVAIAFPRQVFELSDTKSCRLASTLPVPWRTRIDRSINKILSALQEDQQPQAADVWETAESRKNHIIAAKFKYKDDLNGKELCVGTYHMPCLFRKPPTMIIHGALSAQYIQKYAGASPYVFAGDFNVRPKSPVYQLMTTGKIDEYNPEYPPPRVNDTWSANLNSPMGSAYLSVEGAEPDFTNYPAIKAYFCCTLDYIFFSEDSLSASEVISLPHRSKSRIMPNQTQPSDHLLIGATFQCKE